jgi:hypothetical protein
MICGSGELVTSRLSGVASELVIWLSGEQWWWRAELVAWDGPEGGGETLTPEAESGEDNGGCQVKPALQSIFKNSSNKSLGRMQLMYVLQVNQYFRFLNEPIPWFKKNTIIFLICRILSFCREWHQKLPRISKHVVETVVWDFIALCEAPMIFHFF